jgi:hypothetical protein
VLVDRRVGQVRKHVGDVGHVVPELLACSKKG